MRYRTLVADSARWNDFEFREGDIVISTPPKCGTTWTQMLCALLVFNGPEFPAPLERLSPWLDQLSRKQEDVYATYAAQKHRRFIKTHTPLDGLPIRPEVTYVVVGRDPRDVAISMEHHLQNMNMERFLELRAQAVGLDDLKDLPPRPAMKSDPGERLRDFVQSDDLGGPATLAGVLHHLQTAWALRSKTNVVLLHYADMRTDLADELARLARALGVDLTAARLSELAAEASLERMRARADEVVPSASMGMWKSVSGFLRAGTTGEWRNRVTDADRTFYDARVAALVPTDLARWAHLGRRQSGIDPSSAR
jgi:hypothetical protein